MNKMRYTDFLNDPRFIRWQLIPDEETNRYWEELLRQHPEWKSEMDEAISYLKQKAMSRNDLSDLEREWLLHSIQSASVQQKRKKQRLIYRLSAAAALLLLLTVTGIYLFTTDKNNFTSIPGTELITGEMLQSKDIRLITGQEAINFQEDIEVLLNEAGSAAITQQNKEVKTVEINRTPLSSLIVPYGKRSTLTLADGSKVWLNSGSILEFPPTFREGKREIRLLTGEMYIEVAHDRKRPFLVHTSDFGVRVYGTSFNIATYGDAAPEVVLVEGSISLKKTDRKEEMMIHPNERVSFDPSTGSFSKTAVNVDSYISWKDGYLSLDKTPMTELLKRIERYYNLSFNYDQDVNLQKRTCTGKIFLSDNLDNVMTTIALLSSTRYENVNNRIYITND
jgi:ferric-dicitrate binding protein FerR (iron transport regulator)